MTMYASMQVCKYASMQVCTYASMEVIMHHDLGLRHTEKEENWTVQTVVLTTWLVWM